VSNLGYVQTSLKDPLFSVSFFCHLASIILCALILSETLALYKSFTLLYFTVTWTNHPEPTPKISPKLVIQLDDFRYIFFTFLQRNRQQKANSVYSIPFHSIYLKISPQGTIDTHSKQHIKTQTHT